MVSKALVCAFLICTVGARAASAQKGYEFEVYETKIAPRHGGVIELHTNFVAVSAPDHDASSAPLEHAFRSALEVSTGLTSWLEGSLYVVGYARSGRGLQYVGNRARLNALIPQTSTWPVRFGVSQEIGYARSGYAEDRWAYEVAPIVQFDAIGLSFIANPAFERSLDKGPHRVEFEPRAKVERAIFGDAHVALEYYGGIGPVLRAEPVFEQHHQLFATFETDIGERLEASFSAGRGLTRASDRGVIATKLEYHWGK